MKSIRYSLASFCGMLFIACIFFAGWELAYPATAGQLFTYTRTVLYAFYTFVLVVGMQIYGGYRIGEARVSNLVYSQFISEVAAASLAYVVGVANSRGFVSLVPLLMICVVQVMFSTVYCLFLNKQYFHRYTKKRSVVVYRDIADLEMIKAIEYFDEKFVVDGYIRNPKNIEELIPEMEGFEAVFVFGIDATLRNGIAKYCIEHDVVGYIYPHVGDVLMMNAEYMQTSGVPLVRVRRASSDTIYAVMKRLFDITVSVVGIVLTSLVMLVTAIAIKAYDGGPVFYKQVRLTKDGKHFEIFKFRSMRTDAEKDGVARLAADNDDRITPVGKIIRACRIDELPQFFNILKGDMSVVGPRPERPEIAADYEKTLPAFKLRLQCKAGLTGYAQVYGRYNTEPKDKLMMDLMYIHSMSFLKDLEICIYTVKILFMKESTQGFAQNRDTAVTVSNAEDSEALLH